MKRVLFFGMIFVFLCSVTVVFADALKTEQEYREGKTPDIPETLEMGTVLDCGDYSIRLTALPTGTTGILGNYAGKNMKYIVLRLGITNNTDHLVSWLDHRSFTLKEYYLGEYYGTYALNQIISAKAAQSIGLNAFFTAIQPGEELSTSIAFEVYPNVDGWVMSFSPFTRDEEGPVQTIEFKLPDVTL